MNILVTNGERFSGTGANSSYSVFNQYSTITGITAQYSNDRYAFLSNCFQTSLWDMFATGGNISTSQGNSSMAASNCFTGNNILDFACGTIDKVFYFTPKTSVTHPQCLIPSFVGNYEETKSSDAHNSGQCGNSLYPPSPGEYSYIRSLNCNIQALNNYIAYLKSQIATISAQQIITDSDKANLAWLSRHLRYAQQRLARCIRRNGTKQELYDFYRTQQERDFDIKAAGVLFEMGNTSQAMLSLDTIWNNYGGDSLILQSLKLNFIYRDSSNYSALDSSNIATLSIVSAMSDPFATFSRALYYKMTGIRVEPDTTITIPRTKKGFKIKTEEVFSLSPNPSSIEFTVYSENLDEQVTYTYKISDLSGKIVKSGFLFEKTLINTGSLQDGMYLISLEKDTIPLKTMKVIVSK